MGNVCALVDAQARTAERAAVVMMGMTDETAGGGGRKTMNWADPSNVPLPFFFVTLLRALRCPSP